MKRFSSTNCTLAATAVLLSAGAAQGALVLDLTGLGNANSFTDSPSIALVEITGISTNSASLGTNQLNSGVLVSAVGFGGSGTIGVTFTAANAFDETTWTVTNDNNAILSSNSNGDGARVGLGVHTDADGGTLNKVRSLNGDEVLVFTFDTSSFSTSLAGPLQFRVVGGTSGSNNEVFLYEQTGAASGSLLQTVAADNVGTSQWFDVDGLQTFAFQNGNSEGNLQAIEFQVVPEPGSLALLGLGAVFITRRRRD